MKINVLVKDQTTLELLTDAKKGDIIDLKEVNKVDTTYIESLIKSNKEKEYQEKLKEEKHILDMEHQLELNKLREGYDKKILEYQNNIKNKENEYELKYQEMLNQLTKEIELLKQEQNNIIKVKELEISNKFIEEAKGLSNKIELLKQSNEERINKIIAEERLDKEKAINELKEKYVAELNARDETISHLQRQKASLGTKATGEDLESWCNNLVLDYMQNGLQNCLWEKDNKTVKDKITESGTKADYIFKIYATQKREESELLASVCLEMKDENPDSTNKQTNKSHFAKLDADRKKKNCKYAVLVSNLEIGKPNDLPIQKVREYEDMYIVRPSYLMTFLNMLVSLTTRFQDLILSSEINLKDKVLLIEEFNKIKTTYLDKPLLDLEKQLDLINKVTQNIRDESYKIDKSIEDLRINYVKTMSDKINKFEIELNKKIIKKMN